jgi:UrcA family protein
MNATATNRKHALGRTFLLGLAASLSLGAQAGDAKHPHHVSTSVAVSYADLDLTEAAGARTLYARLKSAARKVCGPEPSASDLRRTAVYEACYDRALGKAVNGVDSQRLRALHARRSSSTSMG